MRAYTFFSWLMCCATACVCSAQSAPTQPTQLPALTEPDFFAAGGATITIRGQVYKLALTDVRTPQGIHDHYEVSVQVGGGVASIYSSFNALNVNRPVNKPVEGIQIFLGTPGPDVLVPDGSAKWNGLPVLMFGFDGDDILVGTDTRAKVHGVSWGDAILGGAGNDHIVGLGGEDNLWGGPGDDAICGGDDSDNIMGGDGDDQVDFEEVVLKSGLTKQRNTVVLPANETSKKNLVTLRIGTDFPDPNAPPSERGKGLLGFGGDDFIWGGGGIDFIYGDKEGPVRAQKNRWPGMNYLDGGEDGDFIWGGDGQDTVFGGDGSDQIVGGMTLTDANDDIVAGVGVDNVQGGSSSDNIWGGMGGDILYSFLKDGFGVPPTNDGTNYVDGEDDGDRITSSLGSDRMLGGPGGDTIDGGLGGDNTIIGEDGGDTISVASGMDSISGGAGDDVIICLGGLNVIWGGPGLDVIHGGSSEDFIDGGDGNDQLFGNDGEDLIVDIDTWFNILDGGMGNDELNCFDSNFLSSYDEVRGGPGDDLFWADEYSADASGPGDDLPDLEFFNINEFWYPSPLGATAPRDGRSEPTR